MKEDKLRARSCRVSRADEGTDGWSSEEEHGQVCCTATLPPANTPRWPIGSSETAPGSRSPGSEDCLAQLETKFEQRLAKLESLLQQALTGNISFNRDHKPLLLAGSWPPTKGPLLRMWRRGTLQAGVLLLPKSWKAEQWQVGKRVGVRHNGSSQTLTLQQGQPPEQNPTQPTANESDLSPIPTHNSNATRSQLSGKVSIWTPTWELALPPPLRWRSPCPEYTTEQPLGTHTLSHGRGQRAIGTGNN